jgi:AcrR family transcriptional regulator
MSTPKERRQQRTRQAILSTAREIISESGAESLSMRKIADRIDYSPAGLYEYFESKEEIIAYVCLENERRLANYMAAISRDLDPDARLIALGMAYLRFAKENPAHFMLQFTVNTGGGDYSEIEQPAESSFGILVDAVTNVLKSNAVQHAPEPEAVAYSAWAFVHGMAMLQLTALQHMDQDFESVDHWALTRFVAGLSASA